MPTKIEKRSRYVGGIIKMLKENKGKIEEILRGIKDGDPIVKYNDILYRISRTYHFRHIAFPLKGGTENYIAQCEAEIAVIGGLIEKMGTVVEHVEGIPDDWDKVETTFEEQEKEHAGYEPWERLKSKMKPGDRLLKVCSPLDTWKMLAGREGISLVRNGKMIAGMITGMN